MLLIYFLPVTFVEISFVATVLIIDDEEKLRGLLKRIITLENYTVYDVPSLQSARATLKAKSIDVVICDVKLNDGNGIDFTKEIVQQYPHLKVILLTAYGNIPDGVRGIKNGAIDYLVKGDDNDKILPLLNSVTDTIKTGQKPTCINTNDTSDFVNIIGSSPAMQEVVQLAKKVATTDTSVLLMGETGTGKEVIAQAIHRGSARRQKPFVAINCSAFSKELLESELFGHKAGAFTGANKDQKGLIEEANGGTLFLDEIGEMSQELQPKLLRLLENGTYFRVGDTKEQKADIRLISATNRSLQAEIAEGHFRNDLYYRIAVFTISLPALRERRQDIIPLANHFLAVFAAKIGKKLYDFDDATTMALQKNEWKGNVRELKNVIERAVIMEDSPAVTLQSLPPEIQTVGETGTSAMDLSTIERLHIQKVLKYTNGNKAEASRLLNIGLATLYRKIDEYHLK